ncbi:LPS assembly lipoprotein LptE [Tepidicella baoligensis]|uniref:LPS-assembly lipoprotein LptE n=1 Tax=Tepidicella baoligensis TaxID=2707016 RepID=UPI001FEA0D8F|nr:LPS assembly lipoprotein LptE [Tepidicella baoligensis]
MAYPHHFHPEAQGRGVTIGRRAALAALVSAGVFGLAGCGFRLRGTGAPMAFSSLWINLPNPTETTRHLAAQLQGRGVAVRWSMPGPQEAPVDVVLDVVQDQRERVVVGTTSAGQVRELVLRQRVRFRLRTPGGRELIPDTELVQERELSFTETQVLGKETEEALLYSDIQQAIVRQWMARLAAVRDL